MVVGTLWKNRSYLINIPYIIASDIYEYDIRKANINVLRAMNIIDQDYYNKLNNMSRMERQVEIGYMIRSDKTLYETLSNGIMNYRRALFDANNISDDRIVSIKNDAIFILGKLSTTRFSNQYNTVEFVEKNHYTSYYKLLNLEFYFLSDIVSGRLVIDVKGLGDKIELHRNFIGWIAEIISLVETGELEDALADIQSFYIEYVNRFLDISFYRELNAESKYAVNTMGSTFLMMALENTQTNKNSLDISYNLQIIRTLYGYVSQLFLSRRK